MILTAFLTLSAIGVGIYVACAAIFYIFSKF